jgi:hypothetical protein
LSNDSSIGEKGLGKSDSSKDIVSDLQGHFCSTIAADIPSILLDGVAPLNWILLLKESNAMQWLLPSVWVSSVILAALACVVAK